MVVSLLPLEGVESGRPRPDGGHPCSVVPVASADELLGEAVPDGRVIHQIDAAHRAVVERRVGIALGTEGVSVPASENVSPWRGVGPSADRTAPVDGYLAVVIVPVFVFNVVSAAATAGAAAAAATVRLNDR